jgi:hypothetical protein
MLVELLFSEPWKPAIPVDLLFPSLGPACPAIALAAAEGIPKVIFGISRRSAAAKRRCDTLDAFPLLGNAQDLRG